MPESEEGKIPDRIWPPVPLCILPLFFGLLAFFTVAQSPHFQSYRSLDVIRLITFGAGIGVSFVASMVRLRRPRW